jgi:murein DD-endopeptidase MepM/ murein hydrolase activator NlpD
VEAHPRTGAVPVGRQLAECGNSGNSSEPHLHLQLMDTAHPDIAAGLPFAFIDHDMPRNGEPFVALASER